MDMISSSLGSKEALSYINAFKNFGLTSRLHSAMYKKNKLRVYGELKEDFECKKYLYGVSDMDSKLLFRFRSGIHSLNKELGRYDIVLRTIVKLVCFVSICRTCFMVIHIVE